MPPDEEWRRFHPSLRCLRRSGHLPRGVYPLLFETTLSGQSDMTLLRKLKAEGFEIHSFFLWLKNVDLALSRVKERVSRGGHDVPEPVIRRRFDRSMQNFLRHYRFLAKVRPLFDNSGEIPSVIAFERLILRADESRIPIPAWWGFVGSNFGWFALPKSTGPGSRCCLWNRYAQRV
jgi:predicted ABC-type ATPase